jgi:hypothetical protein
MVPSSLSLTALEAMQVRLRASHRQLENVIDFV